MKLRMKTRVARPSFAYLLVAILILVVVCAMPEHDAAWARGRGHFVGHPGGGFGAGHFRGTHFGGGFGSFGHGSIGHAGPSYGAGGRLGGFRQHSFNQAAHSRRAANHAGNVRHLEKNHWNNVNHTINHALDHRWGQVNNTTNHAHDQRWNDWHDYWRRHRIARAIGMRIATLPRYHTEIWCGSTTYWYAGGTFYRPQDSQYLVVAAPTGCVVAILPPYYETVYVGGIPYYYYDGTYYSTSAEPPSYPQGETAGGTAAPPDPDAKTNYKIVNPPVEATIKTLPKAATKKVVGDQTYYLYQGAYYKPFFSGSDMVYMVVKEPKAN